MPIRPSADDTRPSAEGGKQSSRTYRWITAVCVTWFLGFFGFLIFLALYFGNSFGNDGQPLWVLVAYTIGSLFWLFSASWIYDALFAMAEARWPAMKEIREIVSPLIKAFLFPHHR